VSVFSFFHFFFSLLSCIWNKGNSSNLPLGSCRGSLGFGAYRIGNHMDSINSSVHSFTCSWHGSRNINRSSSSSYPICSCLLTGGGGGGEGGEISNIPYLSLDSGF
jgi:hypothetical protein